MTLGSHAPMRPPGPGVQREAWDGAIFAALLMFLVISLPPVLQYALGGVTSHSHGTGLACAILILALIHQLRIDRFLVIGFWTGLILSAHLFGASMFEPVDWSKGAESILRLIVLLGAAWHFGRWLFNLPDSELRKAIAIVRWLMVAIATAAVLNIQPTGASYWPKPVFPFTEPSHFALVFAPLLIDACVRSAGWRKGGWLILSLFFAYSLENLSLVVATLVAAAVSVPVSRPLPWIVGGFLMATILNLPYFAERIAFANYSTALGTNFSVLVYMQGWEQLVDGLERTRGWGLGFQQLGLGAINSPAADQIYRLIGIDLNVRDGGFLTAKLVSEFGIFGIGIVVVFLALAAMAAWRLRRIAVGRATATVGYIFALSSFTAFTIDVCVRGIGFFSGSALLFFSSCFYLQQQRLAARQSKRSAAPGKSRAPPTHFSPGAPVAAD